MSHGSDEYYVDGVGDAIRLIQASEVEITADYTTEIEVLDSRKTLIESGLHIHKFCYPKTMLYQKSVR